MNLHHLPSRRLLSTVLCAAALSGGSGLALADTALAPPAPSGVLSLTASATVQAAKDWMTVSFTTTRDGADASAVQAQLKQALDAALNECRALAQADKDVKVASGAFSLQPRYGSKGQVNGWTGSTTLTVQGHDFPAIARLTGRVGTMTIGRLDFGLSPEAREKAEGEASAQAIGRYRAKAASSTTLFGYARYEVREVSVQAEAAPGPRPYAMRAAAAPMGDGMSLPVEAGDESVTVTVQGTVQMAR